MSQMSELDLDRQELLKLVNEQAEDEGLWFIDATCSEAYLQAALRRLHAAIEAKTQAA